MAKSTKTEEAVKDAVDRSQEPGEGEWTPREMAEFIVSDPQAVAELTRALGAVSPDPSPKSPVPSPRLLGPGETCAWFDQADETRTALAAIVLGNNGADMLNLEVILPDGTRQKRFGVLHVHDKRLEREPQHRRLGGWELADVAEVRRQENAKKRLAMQTKLAAQRREREQRDRELRQQETPRLVQLVVSQGLTVDEAIAQLGPHWNVDLAHAAIRKSGRSIPRQAVTA